MQDTVQHASSERLHAFLYRLKAFSHWPLTIVVMAFVVILAFILGIPGRGWWIGRAAAGPITGTVFQDYNANGVRQRKYPIKVVGIVTYVRVRVRQ